MAGAPPDLESLPLVGSSDELLRGKRWFLIDLTLRTSVSRRAVQCEPVTCEGWLFSNWDQQGYIHFKTQAGEGLSYPETTVENWVQSGRVRECPEPYRLIELPQTAEPGALSRPSALADRSASSASADRSASSALADRSASSASAGRSASSASAGRSASSASAGRSVS